MFKMRFPKTYQCDVFVHPQRENTSVSPHQSGRHLERKGKYLTLLYDSNIRQNDMSEPLEDKTEMSN